MSPDAKVGSGNQVAPGEHASSGASTPSRAEYGNWMPRKFVSGGLLVAIPCVVAAVLIPVWWLRVVLGAFGALCGVWAVYAALVRRTFSPEGGNLQARVFGLVVERLDWDGTGTCLDVGCGNGPVAIGVAKKYPAARVVASDYWGETFFDVDEETCARNARIEGVAERVEFQFADAAALPWPDGEFDALVSNLVFHEIAAFKRGERYKGLLEALRVLKPGGAFVIQDLFRSKIMHADFAELRRLLAAEVSELHWVDSFAHLKLPGWLNTPIIFKGLGIFHGRK